MTKHHLSIRGLIDVPYYRAFPIGLEYIPVFVHGHFIALTMKISTLEPLTNLIILSNDMKNKNIGKIQIYRLKM